MLSIWGENAVEIILVVRKYHRLDSLFRNIICTSTNFFNDFVSTTFSSTTFTTTKKFWKDLYHPRLQFKKFTVEFIRLFNNVNSLRAKVSYCFNWTDNSTLIFILSSWLACFYWKILYKAYSSWHPTWGRIK